MFRRTCVSVRLSVSSRYSWRANRVVTASDGSEAIKLFQRLSSQIALVVLGLSMPVMSGEECLKKRKGIKPDISVLLSSGFSEAEAVRFQASGVTGLPTEGVAPSLMRLAASGGPPLHQRSRSPN